MCPFTGVPREQFNSQKVQACSLNSKNTKEVSTTASIFIFKLCPNAISERKHSYGRGLAVNKCSDANLELNKEHVRNKAVVMHTDSGLRMHHSLTVKSAVYWISYEQEQIHH